jgi:hypothetical protein
VRSMYSFKGYSKIQYISHELRCISVRSYWISSGHRRSSVEILRYTISPNGFMRRIQHNLRKFCGYLFKMQWIRLNKTVDCSAEFTGFHYIFAEIRRLWSTVNAGEQYIINVCRSGVEVVTGMDTVHFSGSVNIQ